MTARVKLSMLDALTAMRVNAGMHEGSAAGGLITHRHITRPHIMHSRFERPLPWHAAGRACFEANSRVPGQTPPLPAARQPTASRKTRQGGLQP